MFSNLNARTIDSGNSVFSSRNYEWLRLVASHVIAFHNCHLYSAMSCSIPEFVRNLVAYMLMSPLLRNTGYALRIYKNAKTWEMATSESSSLNVNPIELFRELILLPLKQIYDDNGNFNF